MTIEHLLRPKNIFYWYKTCSIVMKHNMSFARRTCHGWGSLNYSIQQRVKQKKRVKVRRQTVRGERLACVRRTHVTLWQIHARRILLTFTDGFSGRQRKFPPPPTSYQALACLIGNYANCNYFHSACIMRTSLCKLGIVVCKQNLGWIWYLNSFHMSSKWAPWGPLTASLAPTKWGWRS